MSYTRAPDYDPDEVEKVIERGTAAPLPERRPMTEEEAAFTRDFYERWIHIDQVNDMRTRYKAEHVLWVSMTFVMSLLFIASLFMNLNWHSNKSRDHGMKQVTFQRNDGFYDQSSPLTDVHWSSLMPKGDGFVIVQDYESLGLQAGKESSQGPMYDVSVFHQLHCLNHIRHYLKATMQIAKTPVVDGGMKAFLDHPDEHIAHCFDYLRQGLMCNADLTFEWPREEKDGSRFAVDGWGVTHTCKDWDAVMKMMDEKRFHQPWEMDALH